MKDKYNKLLADYKKWFEDKPELATRVLLRNDLRHISRINDTRAIWTNAVLNALIGIGKKRGYGTQPYQLYFSSDEPGSQGHNSAYDRTKPNPSDCGEFLTDVCWYNYGKKSDYWNDTELKKISLELCVESEWGNLEKPYKNKENHFALLTDDYTKLLHINSSMRLFITCADSKTKTQTLSILEKLRRCSGLEEGDICIWYWDYSDKWDVMDSPEVIFP